MKNRISYALLLLGAVNSAVFASELEVGDATSQDVQSFAHTFNASESESEISHAVTSPEGTFGTVSKTKKVGPIEEKTFEDGQVTNEIILPPFEVTEEHDIMPEGSEITIHEPHDEMLSLPRAAHEPIIPVVEEPLVNGSEQQPMQEGQPTMDKAHVVEESEAVTFEDEI